MTIGDKQRKFIRMLARLCDFAHANGYELTLGDGYRDPRMFGSIGQDRGYGHKNSQHKIRLAQDYNLFLNGKYLDKTEDHLPLGLFWESIGGTWGGRFKKPDGNHYQYGPSEERL